MCVCVCTRAVSCELCAVSCVLCVVRGQVSVAAAQQAFCTIMHAYSGTPDADACVHRHSCKYATHMVLGGPEAEHTQLPIPAYVYAFAPLARKRALARLRLSSAPIQTNTQLGVPCTQRWCTRGCTEVVASEHHLLFDCPAVAAARSGFSDVLYLGEPDLGKLMDGVYQEELTERIMDFTYRITKALTGPTA